LEVNASSSHPDTIKLVLHYCGTYKVFVALKESFSPFDGT
jgi:hypothetical protein